MSLEPFRRIQEVGRARCWKRALSSRGCPGKERSWSNTERTLIDQKLRFMPDLYTNYTFASWLVLGNNQCTGMFRSSLRRHSRRCVIFEDFAPCSTLPDRSCSRQWLPDTTELRSAQLLCPRFDLSRKSIPFVQDRLKLLLFATTVGHFHRSQALLPDRHVSPSTRMCKGRLTSLELVHTLMLAPSMFAFACLHWQLRHSYSRLLLPLAPLPARPVCVCAPRAHAA